MFALDAIPEQIMCCSFSCHGADAGDCESNAADDAKTVAELQMAEERTYMFECSRRTSMGTANQVRRAVGGAVERRHLGTLCVVV